MVINTPFILASKSLSRKKILKNNGLKFIQIKPTQADIRDKIKFLMFWDPKIYQKS